MEESKKERLKRLGYLLKTIQCFKTWTYINPLEKHEQTIKKEYIKLKKELTK